MRDHLGYLWSCALPRRKGTTLAAGAKGNVAIGIGIFAAVLGVVGSVTAALKLNESVKRNQADHALYLPILRKMTTYAAVDLPSADEGEIRKALEPSRTKSAPLKRVTRAIRRSELVGPVSG